MVTQARQQSDVWELKQPRIMKPIVHRDTKESNLALVPFIPGTLETFTVRREVVKGYEEIKEGPLVDWYNKVIDPSDILLPDNNLVLPEGVKK